MSGIASVAFAHGVVVGVVVVVTSDVFVVVNGIAVAVAVTKGALHFIGTGLSTFCEQTFNFFRRLGECSSLLWRF